jgi:hypothetical protein
MKRDVIFIKKCEKMMHWPLRKRTKKDRRKKRRRSFLARPEKAEHPIGSAFAVSGFKGALPCKMALSR